MILFTEYLNSPYFNKSSKKIKFFSYVKQFYPLFTDERLNRDVIYKKLYPEKKYNDSTLRNFFSELHHDLLNFLATENFINDKAGKYKYLLHELTNKNLNEEWGNAIERFEEDLESGTDYNYFLNKHLISGNKFNYNYLNEKISRGKVLEEGINHIDNSTLFLLYHYILEVTTNYLNVISYSRQFNIAPENNFTSKVASLLDIQKILTLTSTNERNKFILEIYRALLKMNSKPENENLYFEYKKVFYNNIEKLSKDEISLHHSRLTGYCILKIQNSEFPEKFSKELFELYKTILEKEYYKDNKTKYLLHEDFRNILLHGIRMKEYGWVDEFIKTYSKKVHPNDRENMNQYGNAYLNYNIGNYGKALKFLKRINPNFLYYKFDVKNLTLMVYFELGYYEEALYLIKTYLEFLRKNRLINPHRKKRYLSFVKFTEKLIHYRFGNSKHDFGYIRMRIAKHNKVAFKSWLMEKISLLEADFGRAV
ncbi:MAG: hypothetical protein L0Y77_04430 [Chlorobi bacterium]|nr:hypothetical protein [Chlorobiota bacterium]